ncbi:hypothetical protein GOODEAATRI_009849 [Goodea atripinnis]|uniref:Uncharacterized protein n=1 Tax=Goodea atripinnis TaxID=208336 RepID=A0ABV0MQT3_9TELE
MGPNGPNLVFQSCTSHDIEECAQLLPDLSQSGDVFSTNFSDFCKEYRPTGAEIRRILTRKITASDIAKIHNKLPVPNLCLKHEDRDDVPNIEYRNVVDVLAVAIKEEFPRKINMTNIYACKQKGDEDTNDFITRVIEAVTKYSGIETPTEVGTTAGVWETLVFDATCQTCSTQLKNGSGVKKKHLTKNCIEPRLRCTKMSEGIGMEDIDESEAHGEVREDIFVIPTRVSSVAERDIGGINVPTQLRLHLTRLID